MFEVEWAEDALSELATIWTSADSDLRAAVTAATNQIDQHLQADPLGVGESRPDGRRVHFVPPLGLIYRLHEDEQTVIVSRVWLVR